MFISNYNYVTIGIVIAMRVREQIFCRCQANNVNSFIFFFLVFVLYICI